MRKNILFRAPITIPQQHREWIAAILVFCAEFAFGIYLNSQGVILGDAMSRTANAFYVLYCRPYRLASMGLVWNPLPSVLQLPFVLLSKLWRPFVTSGISMSFVSAIFAGWIVKTLLNTFHQLGVSRTHANICTGLIVVNPYFVFYGANGMTELMMGAAMIQVICSFTLWMRKGTASHLMVMGFSFVIMFLIRYEAIPFAVFIALGMVLHIFFSKKEAKYFPNEKLEPLWYTEGTMWVTFLPIIYTVLVWIFYNWSITGNALYFVNSGYSMSAYSAYYSDYGGLLSILSYIWERVWPFTIPVIGLLTVKLFSGKLRKYDTLTILLACFGLTLFTTVMIVLGKSGGYVRYLCYPLMAAIGFIPYVISTSGRDRHHMATAVIAISLVVSDIAFMWGFTSSSTFREDLTLNVPAHSVELAEFINARCRNTRVLMDSYRTYYAIMNVDDIDNLVISCSEDFDESVADPVKANISYVVVPQIGSYGNMDALNIAYPNLWRGGESWAEYVTDIGEFRIFKVKR